MIADWEREWLNGGDVYMGVFLDDHIAGGCGLHNRIGPDGLELGYWTHSSYLRRGIATAVARVLTEAALAVPGTTHVEIHHDKANRASAGVPAKLGYQLIEEVRDAPRAPTEVGISCRWRMNHEDWTRSSS
jgi:ribosomal-protein-serine acetyltransferase